MLVGFVSVPFGEACPVAAVPPVSPPVTDGAFQLYVVPAGITRPPPLVNVFTN
jgi:hypothetical protein